MGTGCSGYRSSDRTDTLKFEHQQTEEDNMATVNFEAFMDNSSSTEALIHFAAGILSFPDFRKNCWHPKARAEVDKLKSLGRKRALTSARQWCSRNGYESYKDICPRCGN